MHALIRFIRQHLIQEREELFVEGDSVCVLYLSADLRRPGILVLINDSDWELEGEMDYVLQPNDYIAVSYTHLTLPTNREV